MRREADQEARPNKTRGPRGGGFVRHGRTHEEAERGASGARVPMGLDRVVPEVLRVLLHGAPKRTLPAGQFITAMDGGHPWLELYS